MVLCHPRPILNPTSKPKLKAIIACAKAHVYRTNLQKLCDQVMSFPGSSNMCQAIFPKDMCYMTQMFSPSELLNWHVRICTVVLKHQVKPIILTWNIPFDLFWLNSWLCLSYIVAFTNTLWRWDLEEPPKQNIELFNMLLLTKKLLIFI